MSVDAICKVTPGATVSTLLASTVLAVKLVVTLARSIVSLRPKPEIVLVGKLAVSTSSVPAAPGVNAMAPPPAVPPPRSSKVAPSIVVPPL